jgi:hypothetical protein
VNNQAAPVPANSLPRTVCRTKELIASKLAIAVECPLRYLLETEKLVAPPLAESIPSLLGTIVHETKDRLMRDPSLLIAETLRRYVGDELLRAALETASIRQIIDALGTPIAITTLVVFEDLLEKLRVARRIASEAQVEHGQTSKQPDDTRSSYRSGEKTFGSEVPIQSSALDLKGRADIIERHGNGVRITEFKTGRVLANGEPTVATLLQVCAYALLQAERSPAVPITVRIVEPNGEWEHKFSRELANQSAAALRAIAEQIPRDHPRPPTEAARPGVACRTCRFRPDCSSYRTWGEKQWLDPAVRLPLDTWGEVTEIARVDERLSDVRLLDANGILVRISNVPQFALARAASGAWLEAYDLTSTEVGRGHAHPCNFHVVDRRRPYQSAYSAWLRVTVSR